MTHEPAPPGGAPEIVIVLDAVDAETVAAFWAAAMHYRRVDRLEQYVVLVPFDGSTGPVLLVQGVPEPKAAKNRMHLDLHVSDPEEEARRLVALGATRIGDGALGAMSWITMSDPEGNEFDLCPRS